MKILNAQLNDVDNQITQIATGNKEANKENPNGKSKKNNGTFQKLQTVRETVNETPKDQNRDGGPQQSNDEGGDALVVPSNREKTKTKSQNTKKRLK